LFLRFCSSNDGDQRLATLAFPSELILSRARCIEWFAVLAVVPRVLVNTVPVTNSLFVRLRSTSEELAEKYKKEILHGDERRKHDRAPDNPSGTAVQDEDERNTEKEQKYCGDAEGNQP
jgi:hypothetical protein